MNTMMRGIRGATSAASNSADDILAVTRELLLEIEAANPTLHSEDIASIFFTVSEDLNAAYPAKAARQLGWQWVPLLCAQEIPVPNGPERVVRVLIHWNTPLAQTEINHIYLNQAAQLRPDLPQPVLTERN